jgi:hypothetical protein
MESERSSSTAQSGCFAGRAKINVGGRAPHQDLQRYGVLATLCHIRRLLRKRTRFGPVLHVALQSRALHKGVDVVRSDA